MNNILIFDYDGVIVDSLDILMENFINACRKNNVNEIDSKEKFLKLFEKNFVEVLTDFGVPKEKVQKILEDANIGLQNKKDKICLHNGIIKMLDKLSKNNKLIIITSSPTRAIKDFLKSKHICHFEDVLGADIETDKVKKIETVKTKFRGYEPFYIGDTWADIIEGRKAGVKVIAVTWGFYSEEMLKRENPDFIVHTPKELVDLIEKPMD